MFLRVRFRNIKFCCFSGMLPSIHFKAEFVRYRMDPDKGARSVIHMDENLSYLSSADSITHVNDNHKLVVEKVLRGPDFVKLIHDISDLVQETPDQIKHQPKSLLYTASFTVGQKLSAKEAKEQPIELVEATACHLPPEELVDFLRINNYGRTLHERFTRDGFQRFLLHVFKSYENAKLPNFLKDDLKNAEWKLSRNLFHLTEEAMKNKGPFLWHFAALGCFRKIAQCSPSSFLEYSFYCLKFYHSDPCLRYPIPEVPFILSRIVPSDDALELPPVNPERPDRYSQQLKLPKDIREQFFLFMCAFAEARWRGCHHEVFAYGMHILSNDKFMQDPVLEKYQLHLWGGLAVSLAKIHTPEIYALSCLANAQQFVKCHSNALDLLLMKQEVMAAFERCEEEEACFQEIMECVPMCSEFHTQSVRLHMAFKRKQLEDMLLQIWSKRKQEHDHTTNGLKNTGTLLNLEWRFRQECSKYKKWMFALCSTAQLPGKENTYQCEIALLDAFVELSYRCTSAGGSDWELNRIMYNLDMGLFDHIKPLLQFIKNEDTFEEYYSKLQRLKRIIQDQTKTANHLLWADLCYMHLILLKIFQSVVPDIVITEMYQDAHTIYRSNNHPRADRLECWVENQREYRRHTFDNSVHKFCSIVWIANTAPRVKALIRHGVSSASKFDIPNSSHYWYW